MIQILRKLLSKIIDNIDSGNSNLSEEELSKVIESLKSYTDKEVRLSKCQACQYLNVSRATFDNLVKMNKLPKGIKESGFKELFWTKKSLDRHLLKIKKKL